MASSAIIANPKPFPTYFVSHGAPSFLLYDDPFTDKEAHRALRNIGEAIRQARPDYIIVVSAHWESSGDNLVEISSDQSVFAGNENKLIYDFYGFPEVLYSQKFKTKTEPSVVNLVRKQLISDGFSSKIVDRGLDHGTWVPLKVAFDADHLDIPLIQVSLTSSDSFDTSYNLGKSLKFFRDNMIWDPVKEKYLKGMIMCSGSSVHNLRDLARSFTFLGQVMPYCEPFNNLIKDTFTVSSPLSVLQNLNNLKRDYNYRQLLYQAHPTLEHFMPLVVAAGTDDGTNDFNVVYSGEAYSVGYGYYRFGEEPAKEPPHASL